jgi:N utilization substance protein A
MAAKKKSKAKKSKRTPSKKVTGSRRPARKQTPKKPSAKKKPTAKKPAPKKKAAGGSKKGSAKAAPRKTTRSSGTRVSAAFELETGSRSAGQSGDLQGLTDVESADSESVDELLEEGNAFEAEAVAGVQQADNHEGQEVHTHEVPEDDVPEEYLDKD